MKINQKLIAACLSLFLAQANWAASPALNSHHAVIANKLVTVYLLIDSSERLQQYVNDLKQVDKVNFNRVIFSFVKPTMTDYVSGNLANTGILGYFANGDGKGVAAFNQLKNAVALSKEKNIQTFLSVGGWDYSCNYAVFGEKCGPSPSNEQHYDWFPDPTDPQQEKVADISYKNLIRLTNDLGMDGIDFDYEEFWHADQYAIGWAPSSTGEWSTTIAKNILNAGGPSYENLMKYATGSGSAKVMPKTVDKVQAILHLLADNPAATHLLFATAAPPVGGRPITGFVYGDNAPDIYNKGGVWWGGNLKGLWYNLADKDKKIVDRFDSIGLMTYDLCGDNAQMCAPYGGAALDLSSQVNAYLKDYSNWLKSTETPAQMTIDAIGKVLFLPAKYHINTKIQFGFEVNQPAYPKNPSGQLQLTNHLVDAITLQQQESDGVIIWQMYSAKNVSVPDATTVEYTLNQSCQIFLSADSRYDCHAHFPTSAK